MVSEPHETSVRPSGENATEKAEPVWPVSVRSSLPLVGSQNFKVLSPLPEASVRPSGENATEKMVSV
jgi:hypothetical protein